MPLLARRSPTCCATPTFQTQLDLPDLSRPEVVASSIDGTTRLLRLRYEYIGQLDRIARKIVGGRQLTWIQELRLDTATFTGTLSFSAEDDADRLNGAADVAITTVDGDATPADTLPATSTSVCRSSAAPPNDASCPVSFVDSTSKPPRCRENSPRAVSGTGRRTECAGQSSLCERPSTSPLRSTETGPSSLTAITVANGSS